jgi:hypothetical protein
MSICVDWKIPRNLKKKDHCFPTHVSVYAQHEMANTGHKDENGDSDINCELVSCSDGGMVTVKFFNWDDDFLVEIDMPKSDAEKICKKILDACAFVSCLPNAKDQPAGASPARAASPC